MHLSEQPLELAFCENIILAAELAVDIDRILVCNDLSDLFRPQRDDCLLDAFPAA